MTTTTAFNDGMFRALADRFAYLGDGYANVRLTAQQAAGWANRGFMPEEAAPWIAAGFAPAEASKWADQFIGPTEARERMTAAEALRTAQPVGSHHAITVTGQLVTVEVCAVDARRGYRVGNQRWGGLVDTWVPFTAISTTTRTGE